MNLQESVCPKCGSKLRMTKRKNRLKCSDGYCNYLSQPMGEEEILEILNYEPTKVELAIDMLMKNSKPAECYGDYDDLVEINEAIEIIKKFFEQEREEEVENDR